MDPLSITASIVAILQLITSITNYINHVNSAGKEQLGLAIEASDLYSLLTRLRFQVQEVRSDGPWFNQVKLLGVVNGPLDRFRALLERMVQKLPALSPPADSVMLKVMNIAKSRIAWKFTKSEVEEILGQIEKLKLLVNVALTTDLLCVLTYKDSSDLNQVRIGVERVQELVSPQRQRVLAQWLGVPDPSLNHHAALQRRHPNTGQWLIKSSTFHEWEASGSSSIWIFGKPGCGKTVLSSTVIESVKNSTDPPDQNRLGYFYFDFNNKQKQSWERAIRSLLFQFCLRTPDCWRNLETLYAANHNGQEQPGEESFHSLFADCLACEGKKYVIIDALDECEDRGHLLDFLENLIEHKPLGLHILVTSRCERDIQEQLQPIVDFKIDVSSSDIDDDIRAYVHDCLTTDRRLKKWPEEVKMEIATELIGKSDGMFRWVYCQLESLRTSIKLSELKQKLSSLPKSLDQTYERVLQRLNSAGQLDLALWVLRWLCYAKQPLKLSEVVEILAMRKGDEEGFFPEERLPEPFDVLQVCSSLVNCHRISFDHQVYTVEASDENTTPLDTEVRLAHYSVQEYLLSDRCSYRAALEPSTSHITITRGCLSYLLHLCKQALLPEQHSILKDWPLSDYAARFWWRHVQDVPSEADGGIVNAVSELMLQDTASLRLWVCLAKHDSSFPRVLSKSRNGSAQSLHCVALTGMKTPASRLIKQGADVDRAISGTTALHIAAAAGHVEIARLLLDAGASVDPCTTYNGETPLMQAAKAGKSPEMVQLLLSKGAHANARNSLKIPILHLMEAGAGSDHIATILLEAGADVNGEAPDNTTALHHASRRGLFQRVRILLEFGASVNAEDYAHRTPLLRALENRHEKVAQMLLDKHARLDRSDRLGGDILIKAVRWDNERIARMVLAAHTDVIITDNWPRRIWAGEGLTEAVKQSKERMVRTLLEAGVNPNFRCPKEDYSTILDIATSIGCTNILRLLREHGADSTARIALLHMSW